MEIRIGNDIRVTIPVNTFGDINPKNIKEATCMFIKTGDVREHYAEEDQLHMFHHSSQYTIHSCDNLRYNASPCNSQCGRYPNSHDCGFVVCDRKHDHSFVGKCKVSDQYIDAYFPAESQHCIGKYKCVIKIKVLEDGWDFDNIHSYTISFEDLFKLFNNKG